MLAFLDIAPGPVEIAAGVVVLVIAGAIVLSVIGLAVYLVRRRKKS